MLYSFLLMNNQNNRGSIWRKWDLHVHTPASYYYKYRGDDWINKMINKMNSVDVEVFAITDYFTLNGYKELLKHRQKITKIIFPGIELRLEDSIIPSRHEENEVKKSDRPINIQIVFDNDESLLPKIEEFTRSFQFKDFNGQSNDLTKDNIIQLGKQIDPNLLDDDAYKKGCERIRISKNQILDKLKEKGIRDRALIILPYEKYGGIDQIDPDVDSLIKTHLTKLANIIESSRESQRKFFLGQSDKLPFLLLNGELNAKFINYIGKPKPCITGSDSHHPNTIGTFPNNKNCWIKADTTFEGLRQIVYEPMIRVYIGEKSPSYLFPQIVSIRLLNTGKYQTKENKELFSPIALSNKIFFSSNLNTIIGPRAAGKTVLVEFIGFVSANKFSIEKSDNKLPLIEFLSQKFTNLIIEIDYQIGEEEIKTIKREVKEFVDPFYTSPLKVEYWMQGEIEKKADNPNKIAEYISDKLTSNLLTETKNQIKELQQSMQSLRDNYIKKLELEIEKNKLESERKQIEVYFDKLKSLEYRQIVSKIRENRSKRQLIEDLIQDIENQINLMETLIEQIGLSSAAEKNDAINLFQKEPTLKADIEKFYHLKETKLSSFVTSLKETLDKIKTSKIKVNLEKDNTALEKQFRNYCEKNKIIINQAEYQKRNERVKYIDQQLTKTENQLEELEVKKKHHNLLVKQLITKRNKFISENINLLKEFNLTYQKAKIKVVWDDPFNNINDWLKNQFLNSNDKLKSLIEKNFKIKSCVREDYLEEIIGELVKKYHKNVIPKICLAFKKEKVPKLEDSGGKKQTINWFFENKHTKPIREDLLMRLKEYSETGKNCIKYGNKILGKDSMSFGERCGTLIELILLSGDHPLIIDQPEDHLDARFVAKTVVDLVREQKINRQIIICTHNANIVVLGDSELVTTLSTNENNEVKHFQGSIENLETRKRIYDVLEGGEGAFRKREQKYGEAIR